MEALFPSLLLLFCRGLPVIRSLCITAVLLPSPKPAYQCTDPFGDQPVEGHMDHNDPGIHQTEYHKDPDDQHGE